jgi:KUP system potassium uptake protein
MPVNEFLARIASNPPQRAPGTAAFLTATGGGVPPALLDNLEHNHVLHEHVVLLTVRTSNIPHVPESERIDTEDLGQGLHRITANYGFQQEPDIPYVLTQAREQGVPINPDTTSYLLNRVIFLPTRGPGMALWRKRLYAIISRNATNAATYFRLPTHQTIEIGTRVEIGAARRYEARFRPCSR